MLLTEPGSVVPTVTIGMPVYNDEAFLPAALGSLLQQDFKDFELVISDNASTDSSSQICESFVEKDERIRYVRQDQNRGQAGNFNYLLGQARGEFFMWAASDDIWDKRFLSVLLNALKLDPGCAAAFTPYLQINDNGEVIRKKQPRCSGRNALARLFAFMINNDDGIFYGLYRTEMIRGAEFPVWRAPNSFTALGGAYPVLCHVLSRGNYIILPHEPLWQNRLHTGIGAMEGSGALVSEGDISDVKRFGRAILRRMNVLTACLSAISRGSDSILLTFLAFVPVSMRCGYDSMKELFFLLRRLLRIERKNGARYGSRSR